MWGRGRNRDADVENGGKRGWDKMRESSTDIASVTKACQEILILLTYFTQTSSGIIVHCEMLTSNSAY